MAKRIKKARQICRFCGNRGVTGVFTEPIRGQATGSFVYELHDRPEGGRCDMSKRPVGYVGWPNWAADANEKAIDRLTKRKR